jgi:small subunit ribosomal protein S2
MNILPGALFVIDPKKEAIAVAEARKLNIPVFAIIDTNCDPDEVDYPIPANDDAFKSVGLITHGFVEAIAEAMQEQELSVEEESELIEEEESQ